MPHHAEAQSCTSLTLHRAFHLPALDRVWCAVHRGTAGALQAQQMCGQSPQADACNPVSADDSKSTCTSQNITQVRMNPAQLRYPCCCRCTCRTIDELPCTANNDKRIPGCEAADATMVASQGAWLT